MELSNDGCGSGGLVNQALVAALDLGHPAANEEEAISEKKVANLPSATEHALDASMDTDGKSTLLQFLLCVCCLCHKMYKVFANTQVSKSLKFALI